MNSLLSQRWTKLAVWLACLAPAVLLYWRWLHDQLGINWIEKAQHITGDWTLRFLLFTLAISPLRSLPGLSALIRYRRLIGLYAFFYGCLHFTIYLWFDKALLWFVIKEDFTTRRFFAMGLLAWLLMLPLAVTSTASSIRRLGGKNWQRLHRLIYVSAIAAVIHYYWQGKFIVIEPLIYAAVLLLLLSYRVYRRTAKSRLSAKPLNPARIE